MRVEGELEADVQQEPEHGYEPAHEVEVEPQLGGYSVPAALHHRLLATAAGALLGTGSTSEICQ